MLLLITSNICPKGAIDSLSAYGYSASEVQNAVGSYKMALFSPNKNTVDGRCRHYRRGHDTATLLPNSIINTFWTLSAEMRPLDNVIQVTLSSSTTQQSFSISAPYNTLPLSSAVGIPANFLLAGSRGVAIIRSATVDVCPTNSCSSNYTTNTGSTTTSSPPAASTGLPEPPASTAIPCSGSGSPAQPVCVVGVDLSMGESLQHEGFTTFMGDSSECCNTCCDSVGGFGKWNYMCRAKVCRGRG